MRSLFLKIFLSFWLAQALFIVLAILVTLAFRPSRGSWEGLRARSLNEAVQAYQRGGEHEARQYLEDLEQSQHIRAFLYDELGNEVSRRAAPEWIELAGQGKPARPRAFPWNFLPNRVLAQAITAARRAPLHAGHRTASRAANFLWSARFPWNRVSSSRSYRPVWSVTFWPVT